MATLVDSNVILDVVTEDPDWLDWSASMLERAAESGRLVINPLVYAEVSAGFDTIEALDDALPAEYYTREALPWEAAFLAPAHLSNIAAGAGPNQRRCPTSTSAHTLRFGATRCSLATRGATATTSRPCRSSRRSGRHLRAPRSPVAREPSVLTAWFVT